LHHENQANKEENQNKLERARFNGDDKKSKIGVIDLDA
jgi:hypothetical protein